MKFVDVHSHLTDAAFQTDLVKVLKRASNQDVLAIITSTTSSEEIEKSLNISAQYPNYVFTSLGADPSTLEASSVDPIRAAIREREERIIGIGEVGLDHYWVREDEGRKRQLQLFSEWIALADELGLPLTVHSRSAGQQALKTVLSSGYRQVLMHAYDGKVGAAMEAAKEGIFFSIPPSVVYSEQKQKLARRLRLENLLLESDAPVLPPVRGERNEPANVVLSARKIAELKHIDTRTVAEVTSENATRLFGLDQRP